MSKERLSKLLIREDEIEIIVKGIIRTWFEVNDVKEFNKKAICCCFCMNVKLISKTDWTKLKHESTREFSNNFDHENNCPVPIAYRYLTEKNNLKELKNKRNKVVSDE